MKRHTLLLAAVIGLGCLISTVAPIAPVAYASENSETAKTEPAAVFVRDLAARALAITEESEASAEEQDKQFRALLHDGFDIPAIGAFVVGRYWRKAEEEDKKRFLELFEEMIITTYASQLTEFSSEDVTVLDTRAEGDTITAVLTEVQREGQETMRVDWKVRDAKADPRIVDVMVEGVSMAVTQRSEYGSVMRSMGGLPGLNKALEKKIAMAKKKKQAQTQQTSAAN